MNRHQRRAARRNIENKFYNDYVRHLPKVSLDTPIERGKVYHLVFHHDDWCTIYDGGGACNCDVIVTRHVEPKRS
jgi:hypothetical protein